MQINREYIEQFDVIGRYLRGRLDSDELDSFEIYILENPDIIEAIERERLVAEAYREHQALLADAEAGRRAYFDPRRFAVAASLVLALALLLNYGLRREPEYSLQPAVLLETFRGAAAAAARVSGEPVVNFRIDVGPVELLQQNSFSAALIDGEGRRSFERGQLRADAEGWLYYSLEGQQGPLSGSYTVRITPEGNPAGAADYPVEFAETGF